MEHNRWRVIVLILHCVAHSAAKTALEDLGGENVSNITQVVRLFERAPGGTEVHTIQLDSYRNGTFRFPLQLKLRGTDKGLFRLAQNKLYVRESSRSLGRRGRKYEVIVQISQRNSSVAVTTLAQIRLKILMSKKNRFPPRFNYREYVLDVFRYATEGHIIATLMATDDDTEAYNQQTRYYIIKGKLTSSSLLLSLQPETGMLIVGRQFRTVDSRLEFEVSANNTGSPQLWSKAKVVINVRDISEPEHVELKALNNSAVKLCWTKPRYGRIKKYRLNYGTMDTTAIKKMWVPRSLEKLQCSTMDSLALSREMWTELQAENDGHLGVPVKIYFTDNTEICGEEPCSDGLCMRTSAETDYWCPCQGEDTGLCEQQPQCEHSDQCSVQNQTNLCRCRNENFPDNCEAFCQGTVRLQCLHGGTPLLHSRGSKCACPPGYTGQFCEEIDPCSNVVCQHGGSCRRLTATRFLCQCSGGFWGEFCQYFDPCSRSPCLNSGFCRNVSDTDYSCFCYSGYFGTNCSKYNPCHSAPCQNRAYCRNITDDLYTCHCLEGFHGVDCEFYSPCSDEPCLHGGMCNSIDGQFDCACTRGRFGRRCEHLNICEYLSPCGSYAAACHNTSDTSFKCICQPGWSGDNCSIFDPCYGKPCLNKGKCSVVSSRVYKCDCASDYYGKSCEWKNHCLSSPCVNGATCHNSTQGNGYMCICKAGYYGDSCEFMNPCITAECMNNAKCSNTSATTFECYCLEAFYGELCQHFNSCHSNPCKYGECKSLEKRRYHCSCFPGYSGLTCQSFDPCFSDPCRNGGECINLSDDIYECTCLPNYYGRHCERYNSCHSNPCLAGVCRNRSDRKFYCECPVRRFGVLCESTDPCAGSPCENGARCIVLPNQNFSCVCLRGYYGDRCEKYNPCASNPCLNKGNCINKGVNKYICQCPPAYQGKICEDDVPCNVHGKKCYNGGTCRTNENETVYCDCPLGHHGAQCSKYDPCAVDNGCRHGSTCLSEGSRRYKCLCAPGFFGRMCESYRRCDYNPCKNNATCVESVDRRHCYCPPGFTGTFCKKDVDECLTVRCLNGASCINTLGSYKCVCTSGYSGALCDRQALCAPEETFEPVGIINWSLTPHSEVCRVGCPRKTGSFATRRCLLTRDHRAVWDKPDTSACHMVITTAESALEALKPFRNSSVALQTAPHVLFAIELSETLMTLACKHKQVAKAMFEIIDSVLDLPQDIIVQSNCSERILDMLETLLSHFKMDEKSITMELRNLEFRVQLKTWIEHERGLVYKTTIYPGTQIEVPAMAFERNVDAERVKLSHFRNSKLFIDSSTTDQNLNVANVISASIGSRDELTPDDCVFFQVPNAQVPNKKVTGYNRCVYWDKRNKKWSTEGVVTLSLRGLYTRCCSNHLSYFAVSVNQAIAEEVTVDEETHMLLASHLGSGLSVLALSVVLFTYSIFRSLNKEVYGQVVLQLCAALLLMNVCLLVGFSRTQVDHPLACSVVAMLTHYFVLSALMWVGILTHFMYRFISQEYAFQQKLLVCKGCTIAWGLPLVAVGISVGLDRGGYGRHPESCLLVPDNRYIYCTTYLLPAVIALLVNSILFVLLVRAACQKNFTHRKENTLKTTQISGTLILIILVGLSWSCSYLSTQHQLLNNTVYLVYTHFATNGIVGLLVFFSFFLLRPEARSAWSRCCKVAGSNKNSTVKTESTKSLSKADSDYTLVSDNVTPSAIKREKEIAAKCDAQQRKSRVSEGVGFDYNRGEATATKSAKQYKIVPGNESYPSSPNFGRPRREQNHRPLQSSSVRLGDEIWVTNTRV